MSLTLLHYKNVFLVLKAHTVYLLIKRNVKSVHTDMVCMNAKVETKLFSQMDIGDLPVILTQSLNAQIINLIALEDMDLEMIYVQK